MVRKTGTWSSGYLVCALLALMCLSGCTATTALLFYPQDHHVRTPHDLALDYQDVWLTAADGTRLHAWWLPAVGGNSKTPTVLHLHGNAENISTHIQSVAWLPLEGVNVLMLDYRGFGLSVG